jgi:anti-sigma B factor antagonist
VDQGLQRVRPVSHTSESVLRQQVCTHEDVGRSPRCSLVRGQALPGAVAGRGRHMSTFTDHHLRYNSGNIQHIASGISTRPVRLTSPEPTRRRSSVDDVLLEPAGTSHVLVYGGVTRGGHMRTTTAPKLLQTLLLTGELDTATAVLGRRQLRGALRAGRGTLILDCSGVQFIDAAWLGVFLSTSRYAGQLDRNVTVAVPSPQVLRALRLVGLEWLTAENMYWDPEGDGARGE